jgi:hypothetical protein
MSGSNPLYYWDTCLFLAWLQDENRKSGEMDGVREIVDRSKRREVRLMTSTITSVEVLTAKIPTGFDTLFVALLKRVNRVSVDIKVAGIAHDLRNYYLTRPQEFAGKKTCRCQTLSIWQVRFFIGPMNFIRSMEREAQSRSDCFLYLVT